MGEFLIGLFVVAVVGIIDPGQRPPCLRAIFRIGGNSSNATSRCTRCDHPTGLQNDVCVYCGFETVSARRRGLKSAMRQVQQLRRQGRLDPIVV